MMLIIAVTIAGMLLISTWVLLIYSPGKLNPYLDSDGEVLAGSIAEKAFVTVGGVKQGMFIKSKNIHNPVLLYIHGGPAFPNYFLFDKFKPDLEDYFTVCYWEQRGGGLSYSPGLPIETMTFEQLTSDAIEVSNYLRSRFRKDKIYVMAHSGGTPIAILAVKRAPQIYKAYIAMAQITRQSESERIAYKYMIEQYTARNNSSALNELRKYPVLETDTSFTYFFKSSFRDKAMHELGIGTMRSMKSVFTGVVIPVLACKAYTPNEKMKIWASKFNYLKKTRFIDELFAMDIPNMVPKLDVPVYFLSGKYDLTVNVDLSKAYLEKLEAPLKGFYTFANSAHSPLFEEPQRVKDIFASDILKEKVTLADDQELLISFPKINELEQL